MRKVAFLGVVAATMATAAQAGPIATTTTPAGAQTLIGAGSTQITFEAPNPAPGTYAALTISGVTFTPNAGGMIYTSNFGGQYNTFGQSIANTYAADAFTTLTMTFAAPTSAFGFFFGASDTTWTLTAYDALNNILDTQTLPILSSGNAGNFYGFSDPGIAKATLVQKGTGDYIFIDDFTFNPLAGAAAVPEPATWGLMLLGFAGVGGMMRVRSRKARLAIA